MGVRPPGVFLQYLRQRADLYLRRLPDHESVLSDEFLGVFPGEGTHRVRGHDVKVHLAWAVEHSNIQIYVPVPLDWKSPEEDRIRLDVDAPTTQAMEVRRVAQVVRVEGSHIDVEGLLDTHLAEGEASDHVFARLRVGETRTGPHVVQEPPLDRSESSHSSTRTALDPRWNHGRS